MMKTERMINFEKLVSQEKSGWLEKALWRQENHDWLEKSALIAIKILRALSDQGRSQKELADKMGVSAQYINKIVKGSENLSLETISKLEKALSISLIEVPGFSSFASEESICNPKERMDIATEPPSSYSSLNPVNEPQKKRNKKLH